MLVIKGLCGCAYFVLIFVIFCAYFQALCLFDFYPIKSTFLTFFFKKLLIFAKKMNFKNRKSVILLVKFEKNNFCCKNLADFCIKNIINHTVLR